MLFNEWGNKQHIINDYYNDLIDFYNKYSYLPYLATIVKNLKLNNALKFHKKYTIDNFNPAPNHYYNFNKFIQGIHIGEYKHIIKKLKERKSNNVIEYYEEPKQNIIDEAILKILRHNKDYFMIIPIKFFKSMYKWGLPIQGYKILEIDKGVAHYKIQDKKIKIIWSNKYINLYEIIIANKDESIWYYEEDKTTKERLTIQFKKEKLDSYIELKETFKYVPPEESQISIIKFPIEFINS